MRICFASDQVFPPIGGEGVSTQGFSLEMAKRGHTVIVLTSRFRKAPAVKDVRIYRFFNLPLPHQKGYVAFPSLAKIVAILRRERINLVQISLPTYLGWQTLRGARKLGIPVILGFHVQTGNLIPPYPLRFLLERILETWFSYFYKKGDIIVAPSYFASQILKKYTRRPIRVVSNGIDLERFDGRRVSPSEMRAFREKHSLDGVFLLVYVGRLSHEKNIGYLLKIMKGLKKKRGEVKLLILGEGNLSNKLEARKARLGLEAEVIFTGFLKEQDLLRAYACADIFISPSFCELQSIATLEAMAMRKAILIGKSKENAAQELVREGVNGYTFCLKDPKDAVEKIDRILSDANLRKSMQEESCRMIQDHRIEKSISELERIYESLLGYISISKKERVLVR